MTDPLHLLGVNRQAAELYGVARRLGGVNNGDAVVRLSFHPYGPNARRWAAALAVAPPRRRGRWRFGYGHTPDEAVAALHRQVSEQPTDADVERERALDDDADMYFGKD